MSENMPPFREPKALGEIFALRNPHEVTHEMNAHILYKNYVAQQTLTESERVFQLMDGIGSTIAGDGFISVFHQSLTPLEFEEVCNALIEVGGNHLRNLLLDAWSIYTKGRSSITLDELQSIPPDSFNTEEKMDRFEQIGNDVVNELQEQYGKGRVWSIEYAKLHRSDFEAIRKEK